MKVYSYEKKAFFCEVKFIGVFCIFIIIASLYLAIKGFLPSLMILFSIVALYTVWNTFVSKSTPEKIVWADDGITFSSFNRDDYYAWNDVKQLRIREFPKAGKMYVRFNNANIFRGRYWLQTRRFSDGNELFNKMLSKEFEINPNSLKAQALQSYIKYQNKNNECSE